MEAHAHLVQSLTTRIKTFHSLSQKFRISHGSTNSTRNQSLRDKTNILDTSQLTSVLAIDPSKKTILVEANVPMDRLIEATLEYNLIPPVVADFPGITVGGAYSGTTGESSSFAHGFFDRTVLRVEMILGNGEVVYLSERENEDLFRGAAGSLGTLGVVTMLEIGLVRAEKFVEVSVWAVGGVEEAVQKCKEEIKEGNDYVDGILFSKISGAVITGRRIPEPDLTLPIVRFSGRKDPWFYMYIQSLLPSFPSPSPSPIKFLTPLPEYLFRYDRGCFWTGRTLFSMTSWLPFNTLTRYILDDFCKTRMLYAALHAQEVNIQIFHDCGVPYPRAAEFIEAMADCTGIWPVWICPLRESEGRTLHPCAKKFTGDEVEGDGEGGQILNVGIWGNSRGSTVKEYVEENWEIEGLVRGVGGAKWLYSPQWSEEEEFYSQFDKTWYHSLRTKYSATVTLPTLYEKSHTDPRELQRKVEAMTWRDVRPFIFPGAAVHFCWKAWRTGQWRAGRREGWRGWVAR